MRRLLCLVVSVSLFMLVPAFAQAQDRGAELAAGYTFRHLSLEGQGANIPLGFSVSVAGRMARLISVVAEVTESRRSETEGSVTASLNDFTFAGGVRFSKAEPRGAKRQSARPFVEFLIGDSRFSAGVSGFGSVTGSALHLEPKGGIDLPMGRTASLRGAVGFEMEHASGGWAHAVRVDVDAVFPLGKH